MTLADAFDEDKSKRKHGAYCTMGILLKSLNDEDRDTLNAVMNDFTWSATRIANVLQSQGHQIGYWVVNRHRSQLCQCVA